VLARGFILLVNQYPTYNDKVEMAQVVDRVVQAQEQAEEVGKDQGLILKAQLNCPPKVHQ
jgi:hypothetical protein